MSEKIKSAFDEIYTEKELKQSTREYVLEKLKKTDKKTNTIKYVYSLAVCLFIFIIGGYKIYFNTTSIISIDINPSLELGINCFDKVISVEGYNDDGEILVNNIDVHFDDYNEAIYEIINSSEISNSISENGLLSIGVVEMDTKQCQKILSDIEKYTENQNNMYCYSMKQSDVSEAHKIGLSCGKYNAFLQLQSLNPDVTAEEVSQMTMREIRDLIESLSINTNIEFGNGHGNEQDNSQCNEQGNRQDNGQCNGQGKGKMQGKNFNN